MFYSISIGHKLDFYSPEINEYEDIGLNEIKDTAFVLGKLHTDNPYRTIQ